MSAAHTGRSARATEPELRMAEMGEVLLGVDGTVHGHQVDAAPGPRQLLFSRILAGLFSKTEVVRPARYSSTASHIAVYG